MAFILPMWRTLKMLEASELLDDFVETLTDDGVITTEDIKAPSFKVVIYHQPFF